MKDFEKIYTEDIVIITVNLTRATMKEAQEFKKLIIDEIDRNKKKIIIDLSECEFMDSTFIGVIVVSLKKIGAIGGELHLIEPLAVAQSILEVTGVMNIFNMYKTKENALKSFRETVSR